MTVIAGPESIAFVHTVTESKKLGSGYPALLLLLKNPDAFRLLNTKLAPSTVATCEHLQYISKMHKEMVLMMEADFMEIHGGRIDHAQTRSINLH